MDSNYYYFIYWYIKYNTTIMHCLQKKVFSVKAGDTNANH